MSFDDVSPPNQPFTHAFRPFSLRWENAAALTICHIVYGFGEYRFSLDLQKYDSREDFALLGAALAAGEALPVVQFQLGEEKIFFAPRGTGEFLAFSWWQEKEGEKEVLLDGETSRQDLLFFIQALQNL